MPSRVLYGVRSGSRVLDIGLIHGPQASAKRAFRKYLSDHRTVIGFTAREGNGSPYDVMRGISSGIDMRRWKPPRDEDVRLPL
jgi:hypothetical protein